MKLFFSIIAWIFNGLCATGLLMSAYVYLIPPEKWLYAPVLAMTFPVWALAMVILLILDLIFWRKVAILAGMAILACWGPLRSTCPLNIPKRGLSDSDQERAFTMMSYNVSRFIDHDTAYVSGREGELYCRHVSYILDAQPDIVCVQEAENFAPWDNSISQAQTDSLHAAYPYVYACGLEFGLLSKYPAEPVNIDFPDDKYKSGSISCWRVNVHGRVINIFSVHLCSIQLTGTSKEAYQGIVEMDSLSRSSLSEIRHEAIPNIQRAAIIRAEQIDLLSRYIRKYGGENVIVCGDFNDVENSYAIRRLQAQSDLKQAWADVGFGPIATYYYYDMLFHIDHILYRGALKPRSIRLDRVKASDHYPQIATFVLNKP